MNQQSDSMGLRKVLPVSARSMYIEYLRGIPGYGSTVFSASVSVVSSLR